MSRRDYIEMVGRAVEEALGGMDCLIVFFGSVLRKDFGRSSDIDVAVYCGRELTGREYVDIMDRIEELPILRDVDLVDLAVVKDRGFVKRVLEEGLIWKGSEGLLKDLRRLWEDTGR